MERKLKVGDRVNTFYGENGTVVYVSQYEKATLPYCVEVDKKYIAVFSEDNLTLIEPERKNKYQKGDKVWHKRYKQVEKFYEFEERRSCTVVNPHGDVVIRLLSEIEPYTGQDKYFNGVRIHSGNEQQAFKPTHPYTVILKSGVKVGISATMFDYINEQDSDTKSVETVADGKIVLSEIAAIVPTENIQ